MTTKQEQLPMRVHPKSEIQRSPIYLLQSREVRMLRIPDGLTHDGDDFIVEDMDALEGFNEDLAREFAELEEGSCFGDQALAEYMLELDDELAEVRWNTQCCFFDRDEAKTWAKAREYRWSQGWRTYAISAEGDLEKLLAAHTTRHGGKPYRG